MAEPFDSLDYFRSLPNDASAAAAKAVPAAGATGATAEPAGKAYKAGKLVGKGAKLGGKLVGPLAAGTLAAEGLLGDATVPNAIRTGVGIGAVANPAVGLPLATGMAVGDAVTGFVGNRLIDSVLAKNDIRGPETKAFLARGGVNQTQGATGTAPAGAELSGVIGPSASAAAPVAAPAEVMPASWQPKALPVANEYVERAGVRGIGGIGGVGNTTVSGVPATSTGIENTAGNFLGAMLGLKQISGDNAQKLAQQKAQAANLAAQGTFARGAAARGESLTAQTLAAEYLKKNPGDFEGAGAVLRGRTTNAGMKPSIPMGGVGLNPAKDPSLVFDPRTKSTSLVYPTQNITMAQAVASAKKNGTYKSDAQVKQDLAKMQNYKLVD